MIKFGLFLLVCVVYAHDEGSGDEPSPIIDGDYSKENDTINSIMEDKNITTKIDTSTEIDTSTKIDTSTEIATKSAEIATKSTEIETKSVTSTEIVTTTEIDAKNYTEQKNEEGEMFNYEQKLIRLYTYDNKQKLYLDTSNNQVQQSIIDPSVPHDELNMIMYSLERNTYDDDNQIVLRHEISLNYFCVTNCLVFYMSPRLTTDCIFIRALVQDISDTLDKIYLKKRILSDTVYVSMVYGHMIFEPQGTFYSEDVIEDREYSLSPVYDESNTDLCPWELSNYKSYKRQTTNDPIKEPILEGSTKSLLLVLICVSVAIITLGVLIISLSVMRYKHKAMMRMGM
uniref:Uncharacterized protein n=1 Tax=Phthorimaea operculella granulovirus TaxID=192584 RepID=A0A1B2CSB1_9BBAC|nr:hypothetical protein PhopGVgp128 [Phthorimaea operculella granulovirus]